MKRLFLLLNLLVVSINIHAIQLEAAFVEVEQCSSANTMINEIEFNKEKKHDQFAIAVINQDQDKAKLLLNEFSREDRYALHIIASFGDDFDFLKELDMQYHYSQDLIVEFAFLAATYGNFEAIKYIKELGVKPSEKLGESTLAVILGLCFFSSL